MSQPSCERVLSALVHMLQVHVYVTECVQVHGAISLCVSVHARVRACTHMHAHACGEYPWLLLTGTIHLPFEIGSLTSLELTKKGRLGMPRIHLSNSHPSDTSTTTMLRSFVVVVVVVVMVVEFFVCFCFQEFYRFLCEF